MEKARAAKSADEIAAIAREQGIEMSDDEAQAIYATFHEFEGEIADDELDNVADGGCGGGTRTTPCGCGEQYYYYCTAQWYHGDQNNRHLTEYYSCNKCGAHWETTTIVDIPY